MNLTQLKPRTPEKPLCVTRPGDRPSAGWDEAATWQVIMRLGRRPDVQDDPRVKHGPLQLKMG